MTYNNTKKDMGKRNLNSWWLLIIGIIGGLLGAAILMLFTSQPRGEAVTLLPPPTPRSILVHVSGAVVNPDVYYLPPDSHIQEAIEAAGGFLPEAYTDTLNLASRLEDGEKILVPFRSQEGVALSQETSGNTENSQTEFPININTATLDELCLLPGIGEVKGQAIIDYREANGPFVVIEQIQNVPGIGPATFEKIKDLITVFDNP
jgi:competence protein ComEA